MIKKLINFALLFFICSSPIAQAVDNEVTFNGHPIDHKRLEAMHNEIQSSVTLAKLPTIEADEALKYELIKKKLALMQFPIASGNELIYAFDAFISGLLWPFSLNMMKTNIQGLMNSKEALPFGKGRLYGNCFFYVAGVAVSTYITIQAIKKIKALKNQKSEKEAQQSN